MWSVPKVLFFTVVAATNMTIVHMLDFCQKADSECQSQDISPSALQPRAQILNSRWNASVLSLIQNLNHFRVSRAFPIDEVQGNAVRTVKNCIFSESSPTPLKGRLRLAAVSKDVLEGLLDLDMSVTQSEEFLLYTSGGRCLPGSQPLAHRYGGHQFGYWAGQLGDGRAHLLGQYTNRKGDTWELQLKGSGKTPYSRSGDGRAVVRSSLREFLGSEAMHFLGVPTSRAASLVVSDEPVLRDQFYDGNVKTERGAVVLRIAKSWFRIGSLEILSRSGELDLLRKLLNFVIEEHFPSIQSKDSDKYLVFYSRVVNDTAHLMAQWASVGFAHGVCNTDNFSLLSITIDYGPFGFMESYNPGFVPNTSDDEGRYSVGAQASVGLFNLDKLLDALRPLLTAGQQLAAETVLKGYVDIYKTRIHHLFKAKLGLLGDDVEDDYIIALLLQVMEDTQADFTMTFRQLSEASAQQLHKHNFTQAWALEDLSSHGHFADWLSTYLQRLSRQSHDKDVERRGRMKGVNPRYVLRNWMAESAIREAEMNNFSEVVLLHRILSSPFITQTSAEEAGYAARPPRWAQGLKVSCSS
ncbi:protein adenylyltransferase SelO-like isoform X2 [Dunckerocampus dactyliophorus]|uniref:protein adenylyltransferase SelO-like isoform X2 n=1 Tax=Dunckerocampus dactyliophorus TaxID=161453 RepID=UPI0024069433|nr:protein adenylyltransferase SelO-like isoform X2 [Dunckerocampus dactyliophorus]